MAVTEVNPASPTQAGATAAGTGVIAIAQGLLRRPLSSFYLLLGSASLLLGIGLTMVLSASSIDSIVHTGSAYTVFREQALSATVGLVAFWVALVMRPHWFRWLAYPLLLISTALLTLLWLRPSIAVGREALWIQVGPVTVQPSEIAKLALVLWGADVLIRKRPLLAQWRQLAIPLLPVAGVLLLLVGYKDLGTMICLLILLCGLLWVSGVRFRALAGLSAVALGVVVLLIGAQPYRLERINSFLNPFADEQNTGYQAVQGLYALSTGGLWGVGLGQSRSKWEYVPEAQNDFIFAIIGEELGLIGCVVVIALYAVLTYAAMRIARRINDQYCRLTAATCAIWLAGQAFINMGAVVGILPITGIPLPLISAGGSSLVITMFTIGMLATFARAEPEAATALRAGGRTWWGKMWMVPLPPAKLATKPSGDSTS
ncbi:MAG: putative lipid II flippase FtsW [Mycobacteriales bacterium]